MAGTIPDLSRFGAHRTMIQVLDPTNEREAGAGALAPRLATLVGATIGIISNGKEGTKGLFGHLAHLLETEGGAARVVLVTKSNYSAPADRHIVDRIREWQAVVTGVGD
jgi:hypothetical protein